MSADPAATVAFEPPLPLPHRMDALETMRTMVSMRWFTEDPVPHDLLMTVLWAAEFEPQIRPILGVPDDVQMAAMIPLGWPAREHTAVRRKPVEEFIRWDTWE